MAWEGKELYYSFSKNIFCTWVYLQYMHNFLWSIVIPLGSHSTHQTIVALAKFESIVHFAILGEGKLAYLSTCLENPINYLSIQKWTKRALVLPINMNVELHGAMLSSFASG